jgi:hypothetical protein
MQICRHDGIEKDFKGLKRFPAPQESLEAWERIFTLKGLREMPSVDQCSGFGDRKIYKARVVPLRENVGRSKGYRVIFELENSDICVVLVFSRHGIYKSEAELIALIKERI